MEERPFLGIDTIDKDLLELVKRKNGRLPDNFVDSAEGAYPGIPDVDQSPAARSLLKQVESAIDDLVDEANRDEGDPEDREEPPQI